MAKIYGLFGTLTGKLADTVMSVRNGEQIARKYQPVVYNPSTQAQVAQRAKLKLLSQLSAVMAPIIAIPKQGPVSSRNLFTKVNFGATSYTNNQAEIDLGSVKITKSVVGLPGLVVTAEGTSISVALAEGAATLSRVVYAVFEKQSDNSLRLVNSDAISTPGADSKFAYTFTAVAGTNYAIYAYGVRDNTEAARVVFGEMMVATAETVAKVITSRQLTESDITLTETKYTALQS